MKAGNVTLSRWSKDDLQNIVKGATLLGSGGGGGYTNGMRMAKSLGDSYYNNVPTFQVVCADELVNKKRGLIVAYMGSPERASKITYPEAAVRAVEKVEEIKGKIDFIIPVEIGAGSSTVACLVAAKKGIPVLDLDGAGRAVPTLDLITFSSQGVSVNPTVLTAEKSINREHVLEEEQPYHVVLNISRETEPTAASKIESLCRPILSMPEYDQMAGLAMWMVDDVKAMVEKKGSCIKSTLTLCKELGEIIKSEQMQRNVNVPRILSLFEACRKKIFGGRNDYKITTLCEGGVLSSAFVSTSGGFDVGNVIVETKNSTMKILFQNESLIVWDSEKTTPLAMAPDLISYLIVTKEAGQQQIVYTNDDIMENGKLKSGLQDAFITVIALQAPEELRMQNINIEKLRNRLMKQFENMWMPESVSDHSANLLPKSYMNVLNRLGYYGKYVPIEKIK